MIKYMVKKFTELVIYSADTEINEHKNIQMSSSEVNKAVVDAIAEGYEIYDKSIICTDTIGCVMWILRKKYDQTE